MSTAMSPYTAMGLLVAFKQRKIGLDEEIYDQCLDVIVALLEEVNDEKYRLTNRQPVTPES